MATMLQQRLVDLYHPSPGRETLGIAMDKSEITFYGKLEAPVHRWFRMTASFSPQLVHETLRGVGAGPNDLVLDPFSGAGTTLVEAKRLGIPSIGVELNPVFALVAAEKLRWDAPMDRFEAEAAAIVDGIRELRRQGRSTDPADYANRTGSEMPTLSNIERWWSPSVLTELLCARRAVRCADPAVQGLLTVGLASILVAVSNAGHHRVSLSFLERPRPDVDVATTLERKYRDMATDIREMARIGANADSRVMTGDSRQLPGLLPSASIDHVITSPPYPNRFTYTRETRPHLYFLGFMTDPGEAGDLDLSAIGGTWGKATSVLQQENVKLRPEVADTAAGPVLESLAVNDQMMYNYVAKYFNDILANIDGIATVAKRQSTITYVVGNSFIKGVEVPTDEIVADMFEMFGYDRQRIARARKRNSRRGLTESVVHVSRKR